ncbi:MAG: hypothetical protein ACQEWU_07010 [Bacillota bacterium]|nr:MULTISPECIES: hypothetical protein [Virgibacillus]WBX80828.1 hypothetical protein PD280_03175 [Virgibacillus salarius]
MSTLTKIRQSQRFAEFFYKLRKYKISAMTALRPSSYFEMFDVYW